MKAGRMMRFCGTIAFVVLLLVPACADEPSVPEQAFDADAYCEAEFDRETLGAFESEDEDELKRYAKQTILPAHEAARDAAPESLRESFDRLVDAASQMADTGDPHGFGEDAVADARTQIHAEDLKTCEWTRVDVTATDYEFDGLEPAPDRGRSSLELRNEGKEPHEIVLFKVNEGVTDTIEELLDLPEDEVMKKVTRAGAAFAEPGQRDYGIVDLRPGRYGAVCFIPVGGGEEGPPHFTKGMFQEFTVE